MAARVVDAKGSYAIPGLWDMHTHTLNRWRWAFPLHVANGVTGIRDLSTSTPLAELRQLKVDVASGVESAPGVKDALRISAFVTAARSPATLSST